MPAWKPTKEQEKAYRAKRAKPKVEKKPVGDVSEWSLFRLGKRFADKAKRRD